MLAFSTIGGVICLIAWYCTLPISPGFCNSSAGNNDILFSFIRPVDDAFNKEAIEPVEEALVNTCKHVDSHYTYTAQNTREDDSDNDSDSRENDIEIDQSILGSIDTEC